MAEPVRVGPRKVVLAALTHARNLGVLGVSSVVAASCFLSGATMLGVAFVAIGAAGYLTAVGQSVLSDNFMAKLCGLGGSGMHQLGGRNVARLPANLSKTLRYPDLRESLERIQKKVKQIEERARAAPETIRRSLEEGCQRYPVVLRAALSLAERGQRVLDYLAVVDRSELHKELVRLKKRMDDAKDRGVVLAYSRAYDARRKHLLTCDRLQATYDGVTGHLQYIESSLDNTHATLVKLVVAFNDASGAESDATSEIDAIASEVEMLDLGLADLCDFAEVEVLDDSDVSEMSDDDLEADTALVLDSFVVDSDHGNAVRKKVHPLSHPESYSF